MTLVDVAVCRMLRVAELDPLELTSFDFERLPEYSLTLPTGTIPGKRWRRDLHWDGGPGGPLWVVGEFGAVSDDGERIALKWYVPVVRDVKVMVL